MGKRGKARRREQRAARDRNPEVFPNCPLRGDPILLVLDGAILPRAALVERLHNTHSDRFHTVETVHHGYMVVEPTADPFTWVAEYRVDNDRW